MALDCQKFSSYLARRTPNFLRDFVRDLHPRDVPYTSLYQNKTWTSYTGTEHTWDRIHVAMPNDAGDWEEMNSQACAMNICDPSSRQIDWGSTRATFHKFRRRWKTRILCLDQIRHVEEAEAQLEAIWQGLSKVPEYIQADWLKYMMARGSDFLYPCSSSVARITTTTAMFTGGLDLVALGAAGNLPTSKLVMPYLMQQIPRLQYNGYFDGEFTPAGKFKLITDIQTAYDLCNGNPALTGMYDSADFEKGGKYYQYGAMMGCGNFLIQINPYPPRFNHAGGGVLRRVWPFQNTPATIGLRPVVDQQYEDACYQMSVIPHRLAREIYVGEIPSIHPKFNFGSRDLWGKWKWINDDYLVAFDPNTGATCEMDNPVKNKGYFLADFEAGIRDTRPELECVIIHLREKQAMVDLPRCDTCDTWNSTATYQSLLPYNNFCPTPVPEEA